MSIVGDSDIRKKVQFPYFCFDIYIYVYIMFIICTNTCFNLHIPLRFVHGVSYLLYCILQENVGETRFISR